MINPQFDEHRLKQANALAIKVFLLIASIIGIGAITVAGGFLGIYLFGDEKGGLLAVPIFILQIGPFLSWMGSYNRW